jgi:DNA binding domain, excisionase family
MDENMRGDTATQPTSAMSHPDKPIRDRRVWSVDETAEQLGISRAHAYELIARREIPHLRLGRRIVVPRKAVDELLDRALQRAE